MNSFFYLIYILSTFPDVDLKKKKEALVTYPSDLRTWTSKNTAIIFESL